MTKAKVKKLIISLIVGISVLFTLLTLCFKTVELSIVGIVTGLKANGFNVMGFKLPELLGYTLFELVGIKLVNIMEVNYAILSYAVIVCFLIYLIIYILSLVKPSIKNKKAVLRIFIGVLVLSFVYALNIIILNAVIKIKIPEGKIIGYTPGVEMIGLKTLSFIPLIIQAVLFTAYILCDKLIKTENTKIEKNKVVESKAYASNQVNLVGIKETLEGIIELVKDYKSLLDNGDISSIDYFNKKGRLLIFFKENVENFNKIVKIGKPEEIIQAEKYAIESVKKCKDLLNNEYITDAEYIELKSIMLYAIIK